MKEYSRRDFIKGAAAGAVGLAGLSLIGGCSTAPASSPQDKELIWDQETDVIVVGTGTVITAAIAACEMGIASITVLEKDENIFGGTSTTSGGGYALPGFLSLIHIFLSVWRHVFRRIGERVGKTSFLM